MWTQEEATFEGTYYQVHGAINQPKGVQKPHIPLLIGGGGEKVTLKLVAQYGDACNVDGDLAAVEHKLAVLKQHCQDVGRDYASIKRTAGSICLISDTDEQARALLPERMKGWYGGKILQEGLIGSPETIRKRIAAYEAIGVQELILIFPDAIQLDGIRRFAKKFHRIKCLTPSGTEYLCG